MTDNLTFYSENTDSLISQYDSVTFDSVHGDWLVFLPSKGNALDIGAGSGRDARYLAGKGLKVYAAEPCLSLLESAQKNSESFEITWLKDVLPSLNNTRALAVQFDLILLSAVWMHLTSQERKLSMAVMSELLNVSGRLVITLRHGGFSDGRTAFPVSADEVINLAKSNGLSLLLKTEMADDQLGRGDVAWQTLVFGK